MWRKGLVSLIATLLVSDPALAQAGRITGTVTATDGNRPLPGAQVRVMGTMVGALSGENGRYSITVAPGTYTLRVTRIGYAPDSARNVVVSASGEATADFRLSPTATVLTGMVVIGYGEQQAERTTGSVGVVSSEQFNQGRIVSPQEAIQGKIAGVQVVDNNEPGGGVTVRVRGTASVTASSDPLYVVDGVPLQSGGGVSTDPKRNPLNFINPQDIENITVLKDASATAIYGSRGSNGVVIITTKKGSGEGTHAEFTSTVSSARVDAQPDMLSAAQFRQAITEHAPQRLPLLGNANTDWRDLVQQNGVGREQQLALSGKREDMNYRLSVGYLDQTGVVRGTVLRRGSTSFSYNDKLFNDFDVTANIKGSRSDDRFTPGSVIGAATAMPMTQPVRNPDGTFYYWVRNDTLIPQATANPVAALELIDDHGTTYRSVGNLETKYHAPFLTGLTATLNIGYDLAAGRHTIFTPSTEYSQLSSQNGGNFQRYNPSQTNTVMDLYGNYKRDVGFLGSSNVDLTGGYSYEQSRADYPSLTVNHLSTDLLGSNGIPASTTLAYFPGLDIQDSRLISFFGRGTWTLRDRYITTLSVRRDGSSKFGPNSQWGTFPAAAFAWRVSEEPFMKNYSRVSDLKLRASWGVNGNQQFDNYKAISSYTISNSAAEAQWGQNNWIPTIRPSAVDPGLKWEQTASYDVGADWGVMNNRFAGTIDYYYKKTNDLLFTVPVAAGTNLADFLLTNIGSMENRGFELGLNAQVLTGGYHGLTWSTNFNASTNNNKLLRINSVSTGGNQIPVGGISGGVNNKVEVLQPGEPLFSFLVFKHKYVNGKPVADCPTLAACYVDVNGDSTVDDNDKRIFHSPAPKWILGHSSNFMMGNFDASYSLRAYLGNYTYNNVASNLGNYAVLSNGNAPANLHASVLKNGFTSAQYYSDIYVEDASFLRLDNVTLGYTFHNLRPVQGLRVFGTIQNAFTWTKYSGVDPTAGVNGIDNNLYPRSRTFLGGANFQF